MAARERPDLVLLDVVMPDMDGLAVCRQLQTDPQTSHIPIILVTGQGGLTHCHHSLRTRTPRPEARRKAAGSSRRA